jgi:mRNA-degrading endonuclease RelE of RelBE toxin-antitoxin system
MSARIEFAPRVLPEFDGMTAAMKQRLVDLLVALEGDPRPSGVVEGPGRPPVLRWRSGGFRILYEARPRALVVLDVRADRRGVSGGEA